MRIETFGLRAIAVLALGLAALGGCGPSSEPEAAVDAKSAEILGEMSRVLAARERMTIQAERSVDPALIEGREAIEKATITVTIARPDRCRGTAVGEDHERRVYYDGKTFVLHDVGSKVYGLAEFEGDLDAVFDELEKKFGVELPLSAFLCSDPYTKLLEHVTVGKYVGEESVDGAPRHHLHFTEELLDWDLWTTVETDLPYRLVITAKAIEGNPEVRIDFEKVDMEPMIDEEKFTFTPVEGVTLAEMMSSDDLE